MITNFKLVFLQFTQLKYVKISDEWKTIVLITYIKIFSVIHHTLNISSRDQSFHFEIDRRLIFFFIQL